MKFLVAAAVALVAWLQASVAVATVPPIDNDFLPTERGLGDCISALPKPGCGSEARGGPMQTLLFVIIMCALAFIAWRVWRSLRAANPDG